MSRARPAGGQDGESLIHPGHPLMQAVTDIVLEQHRNKLKQGAVLVDPADPGLTPRLMFIVDHAVKEGRTKTASSRAACSSWRSTLQARPSMPDGAPPRPEPSPPTTSSASATCSTPFGSPLVKLLINWSSGRSPMPDPSGARAFRGSRTRRVQQVDKTSPRCTERLVKEINYWQDRSIKLGTTSLQASSRASTTTTPCVPGRALRPAADPHRRTAGHAPCDLQHPTVVGGALVIPQAAVAASRRTGWSADAARARIEALAMRVVMDAERPRP